MYASKRKIDLAYEAICIVISCAVVCFISLFDLRRDAKYLSDADIYVYLISHISLSLFAYFIIRLLFNRIFSLTILSLISFLLYYSSYVKYDIIREPLIFNDLTKISLMVISIDYTDKNVLITIIGIVVLFIIAIFIGFSKSPKLYTFRVVSFIAVISVIAFSYPKLRDNTATSLSRLGFVYHGWDMEKNFRENGVFIHLIQTSLRKFPARANDGQIESFLYSGEAYSGRPQKIIFILCESCWYDDVYFSENFEPLITAATEEVRGISPIFGGLTPNATFEILTGLPVKHSAISGVVYHEYRDFLSDNSRTLPRALNKIGYNTIAAHNFVKHFWARDTVKPILGFDAFYGLEDINIEDTDEYFPYDRYLFDFAEEQIADHQGDYLFMHLTTVHPHGPYEEIDNDFGVQSYLEKIDNTVADASAFMSRVMQTYDDTVILFYSDHKPPMWKFFSEKSIARSTGDVPILIFDNNKERVAHFSKKISDKPFYCITSYFMEEYIGISLPQSYYVQPICSDYVQENEDIYKTKIPDWVYWISLFD